MLFFLQDFFVALNSACAEAHRQVGFLRKRYLGGYIGVGKVTVIYIVTVLILDGIVQIEIVIEQCEG